jgi:hypothetical protein
MDDDSGRVVIRDERCQLILHRPERLNDYFEHRIDVTAGPFRGAFNGVAYMDGWGHFIDGLRTLYEELTDEVSLDGYENFTLSMRGDGLGHITVSVSATVEFERPIVLSFRMYLDQTQLPEIVAAIDQTFSRPAV